MKKLLFTLILSLILVNCKDEPLVVVAKQENHYNHQIFEENKLPPRATFFGFESANIDQKKNPNDLVTLMANGNSIL